MPKSVLALLRHSAGTIKDPMYWYTRGLSDHSPVFRSLSLTQSCCDEGPPSGDDPVVQLRLKKEWCCHPHYAKRMVDVGPIITQTFLDLSERSQVLTNIMREFALQARDIIFLESLNCEFSQLTRLASVSRVFWFHDLKLANILLITVIWVKSI